MKKYRIRKLTPRECWRLMGFSDADFDKAVAVNSDTQLYAQAGNSIVVNVLEAIFKQMIRPKEAENSGGVEQLMGQMVVYDYDEMLTDEMRKGIEDGKYRRSTSIYELRGDL